MTRKDAALLASRALALYLFAWALNDLSYVPQTVISLRHNASVLYTNNYWRTYYSVALLEHLLRTIALFITAVWLYRCGQAFFLPSQDVAPESGQ